MLKLYRIYFFFLKDVRSLQPVLASAKNKNEAIRRARAFVASNYPEQVVHDYTQEICSTPDDVLEWA